MNEQEKQTHKIVVHSTSGVQVLYVDNRIWKINVQSPVIQDFGPGRVFWSDIRVRPGVSFAVGLIFRNGHDTYHSVTTGLIFRNGHSSSWNPKSVDEEVDSCHVRETRRHHPWSQSVSPCSFSTVWVILWILTSCPTESTIELILYSTQSSYCIVKDLFGVFRPIRVDHAKSLLEW
jgi:hypothetical protein